MTTIPQAVTERYVSNLIHYGRNKEFDICSIQRQITEDDGVVVGVYFTVMIRLQIAPEGSADKIIASGATISQAVRRALEKHGVTFR